MIALLAIALSLTEPLPLDMPRASAYLVEDEAGRMHIEDRYPVADLWVSQTVAGRWMDDDGRIFVLSDLRFQPPPIADVKTRRDYAEGLVAVNPKETREVLPCIRALSPVEPAEKGVPAKFMPRGCRDVRYYEGTNAHTLVCAFLRTDAKFWRLATWDLLPEDDREEARKTFEDEFLSERLDEKIPALVDVPRKKGAPLPGESAFARRDVRHTIAAYANWHFTDGDNFVVIDDLTGRRFVTEMTNDLARMRARYAATIPAPVDVSNTLAVVRLYTNRDEYLDALEEDRTNLAWTAAYWCSRRRELVAHYSAEGSEKLMRTLRHEAFHQYLSYAVSMVSASPWFNEGYAEYFEDENDPEWGLSLTEEFLKSLASEIPKVMAMDYEQFYAGSNAERHLKYRLAWSIAYFIEKGAPDVPFTPFKNLKRDYMRTLYKTRSMRQATANAFGNDEILVDFVNAWLKFWKERL